MKNKQFTKYEKASTIFNLMSFFEDHFKWVEKLKWGLDIKETCYFWNIEDVENPYIIEVEKTIWIEKLDMLKSRGYWESETVSKYTLDEYFSALPELCVILDCKRKELKK